MIADQSKFCKLKYNINAKSKSQSIKIDDDKILSSKLIPKNTTICECEPIISYYRLSKPSSLPLALNLIPNDDIFQILTNIRNLKMYPNLEEDMTSGLKQLVSDEQSISKLIKQPKHAVQVYLKYNHFNNDNNSYLYLLASKFNHSCKPNCSWKITDGLIKITSLRNILPFEECTIPYIDLENFELNKISRQNIILDSYGFVCKCKECIIIPIDKCYVCNNKDNLLSCSTCKNILYCGKDCQRLHWSIHKINCNKNFDK